MKAEPYEKTVEKAGRYKRWRGSRVTAECHRRGSSIPLLGWRGNSTGLLDEPSGTSLEIKPQGSPWRRLWSQGRIQQRRDEKAAVRGLRDRWHPTDCHEVHTAHWNGQVAVPSHPNVSENNERASRGIQGHVCDNWIGFRVEEIKLYRV